MFKYVVQTTINGFFQHCIQILKQFFACLASSALIHLIRLHARHFLTCQMERTTQRLHDSKETTQRLHDSKVALFDQSCKLEKNRYISAFASSQLQLAAAARATARCRQRCSCNQLYIYISNSLLPSKVTSWVLDNVHAPSWLATNLCLDIAKDTCQSQLHVATREMKLAFMPGRRAEDSQQLGPAIQEHKKTQLLKMSFLHHERLDCKSIKAEKTFCQLKQLVLWAVKDHTPQLLMDEPRPQFCLTYAMDSAARGCSPWTVCC